MSPATGLLTNASQIHWCIWDFFSSEEIADRIESVRSHCARLWKLLLTAKKFFLNSMMPFAEVDGYNLLCVAFKEFDRGKIFLVEWYFHHQNKETLPFSSTASCRIVRTVSWLVFWWRLRHWLSKAYRSLASGNRPQLVTQPTPTKQVCKGSSTCV